MKKEMQKMLTRKLTKEEFFEKAKNLNAKVTTLEDGNLSMSFEYDYVDFVFSSKKNEGDNLSNFGLFMNSDSEALFYNVLKFLTYNN